MTRRDLALAVVMVSAIVTVIVLFLLRGGLEQSRYPEGADSLPIHDLSIAITRYEGRLPSGNAEVAKRLVDAGLIDPKHVCDGLLLDRWGVPYAVFVAEVHGKDWSYPETMTFEWGGQAVKPRQVFKTYPPLHQVISAGPDRTFGTEDDLIAPNG